MLPGRVACDVRQHQEDDFFTENKRMLSLLGRVACDVRQHQEDDFFTENKRMLSYDPDLPPKEGGNLE